MKEIKAFVIILGVSLLVSACGAGNKDSKPDKTRASEATTQVSSQANETVNSSDADTKASEGESGTEKTGEDTMNRITLLLEDDQVGVFTFDKGTEFDFKSELAGKTSLYTFTKESDPEIIGMYINEDKFKQFEHEFTDVKKQTREKDKVEYWRYEKKLDDGKKEQNLFIHFPESKMYFYVGGNQEDQAVVDRIFDALTFYYTVDKDGKLVGAE